MSLYTTLLLLLTVGSLTEWGCLPGVLGQRGRPSAPRGRVGDAARPGRPVRPVRPIRPVLPLPTVTPTGTPPSFSIDNIDDILRTASGNARAAVTTQLAAERRVGRPGRPGLPGRPVRPVRPAGGQTPSGADRNDGNQGPLPAPEERQGQRAFRGVASFLGSSVNASRLSFPAKRQLETLRFIQRRFRLSRAVIRNLLRRGRTILRRNPMGVRPDMGIGDIPSDFDTCPFPDAASSGGSSACRRNDPFRTIDGTCNNLRNPLLGRSLTPLVRALPSDYADGFDAPRLSKVDAALPSARKVSLELFKSRAVPSQVHTYFLIIGGQFLDHDMTRTAISTISSSATGYLSDVTCGDGCSTQGPLNEACFPILVGPRDPDFSSACLQFVRTQPSTSLDCQLGPRQQLNQLSHYIDASNVYGSTKEEAEGLRDNAGGRGLLAVTKNPTPGLKPLLPQARNSDCRGTTSVIKCFRAGDERVNENVGLSGIHLIMVRVHNSIAEKLRRINPKANGERVYQTTRKILGGIWQHVVYNEYLPIILGPELIRKHNLGLLSSGFSPAYDASASAEVSNVFATAAFRFSHSLISDTLGFNNQNFDDAQTVPFSTILRRPAEVYNNRRSGGSGTDSIMLGLVSQRARSFDRFFSKEVTARLFSENPPTVSGTDLVSLNLQRGRDHGIAGYNAWRKYCNLHVARNFNANELRDIEDRQARQVLKRLYRHVDDIDLFAGAMSEKLVPGGMIGPTFGCILAQQFRNSKVGDRFWYETSNRITGFTPAQLTEIRKITMAKLVCNSMDNVNTIQKFVMLQPFKQAVKNIAGGTKGARADDVRLGDIYHLASLYRGDLNERRPCCALPDIDFTKWRD